MHTFKVPSPPPPDDKLQLRDMKNGDVHESQFTVPVDKNVKGPISFYELAGADRKRSLRLLNDENEVVLQSQGQKRPVINVAAGKLRLGETYTIRADFRGPDGKLYGGDATEPAGSVLKFSLSPVKAAP